MSDTILVPYSLRCFPFRLTTWQLGWKASVTVSVPVLTFYEISVLPDHPPRHMFPLYGSGLSLMNSRGCRIAVERVHPAAGNVSAEDVQVRAHEGELLAGCAGCAG